jgi:hypothetical protein
MLWNHPGPLGIFTTPYVLIFVIVWFLLRLYDCLEVPPPRSIFWILRVVTVLVGLILCIL